MILLCYLAFMPFFMLDFAGKVDTYGDWNSLQDFYGLKLTICYLVILIRFLCAYIRLEFVNDGVMWLSQINAYLFIEC